MGTRTGTSGAPDRHAPARLANLVARGRGLVCKYEGDSGKRSFRYKYFRRGRLIGSTGDPARVVKKMWAFIIASAGS